MNTVTHTHKVKAADILMQHGYSLTNQRVATLARVVQRLTAKQVASIKLVEIHNGKNSVISLTKKSEHRNRCARITSRLQRGAHRKQLWAAWEL